MIPAGTALNQPVCVYGLQFGIVDDQIVENSQHFSVVPSSVFPTNTLTVSDSFTVTIQDNDCEWSSLPRNFKPSHSNNSMFFALIHSISADYFVFLLFTDI